MQLEGAGALVTGGGSGLGAATVETLAERGARVTVVDRDAEAGAAQASRVENARFVEADVTDPDAVEHAVEVAGGDVPLRIAVNCAGIGPPARVVDRHGRPHDLDHFVTVVQVNLVGTFNVMRLAAAAMAGNDPLDDGERGVVVNTASIAAFEGQIGQVSYSASKGGIVGMTLPAARDLAVAGIRVVTIAPGSFDTPLYAGLPQATKDELVAQIPFPKRLGAPREFAALVCHICENVELNGETIRLDGGVRMPSR